MKWVSCALLVAVGCTAGSDPNDDVIGPFTGPTHRYVVDRIELPRNNTQAREVANDLDGNGRVDNALGMVISTITSQGIGTEHGPDMIASGAIASSFEITADDLANDDTVSVLYRGNDSSTGVAVGGRIENGAFRSNRSATTRVPGHAFARLPVFADADPSEIAIDDMEIDLVSDGNGGFDAIVRGSVDRDAAIHEAYRNSMQMLAADPDGHFYFMALLDKSDDWVVTESEFETNSLITSLFSPDLEMHGEARLSIGFRLHLSPCDAGTCATSPPADTCHDRVRDGDESDVDCGGSCGACPAGAACAANTDCDSQRCDGTDHCAATSCNNGVRDGFETDVDCGSNCGATCTKGMRCHAHDCAPGLTCGPDCDDPLTCEYPYFDTCQY